MYNLTFVLWVVVLSLIPHLSVCLICSRYPANTLTPKSPVDENFAISIVGHPETYILGHSYNVSLNAYNGLRFVSFMLALENDNGVSSYNDDLGHFEITDSIETRFSPNCVNVVENTNTNSKSEINLVWVAPKQPGSGCVLIRATLLQHRDVWYMDDGGLTKRVCEEVVDDVESQKINRDSEDCCACDEARYEITFEGVWSRNLHPKDFPTKGWITRFSDIIGATHTNDYRLWQYGELASESMKEFGEHGSTRQLEREFNHYFMQGKIRTILKARGPVFPNLNSKSVASVRVDPQHHLLSLASKVTPSPDWIVGVSGLEMCMRNCTWLEHKVITLYPWDLGTDGGPSYTSADQPQVPADVIRRIRSDFPNDPRSPFYDESGAPMKPMATLTVRLLRTYERLCEDDNSNNTDDPRECVTHPWSAWTECTAKCGQGRQFRRRVYKQPLVAKIFNCDLMMVNHQQRECTGNNCANAPQWNSRTYASTDEEHDASLEQTIAVDCELTPWTAWTECSKACGEGKMMRTRQYVNPRDEQNCQNSKYMKLYQYQKCMGRSCLGSQMANNEERHGYNNNTYNSYRSMHNNPYANDRGNIESGEDMEQTGEDKMSTGHLDEQNAENYYDTNVVAQHGNYKANFEVGNLNKYEEVRPPQAENRRNSQMGSQVYAPLNALHRSNRLEEEFNGNIPECCLKGIHVLPCFNSTVIGNYWFYNYCSDECMLYATDSCDRNENKFASFEACERRCRRAEHKHYLRQLQLRECY